MYELGYLRYVGYKEPEFLLNGYARVIDLENWVCFPQFFIYGSFEEEMYFIFHFIFTKGAKSLFRDYTSVSPFLYL